MEETLWAVYGGYTCQADIGIIENQDNKSAKINLGRGNEPEVWDSQYTEIFSDVEEAIEHYLKLGNNIPRITKKQTIDDLIYNFPEHEKELKNLLQ